MHGLCATAVTVTIDKAGRAFTDISSHNGTISVDQYRQMKSQGIEGVVVKLTEYTTYTNPYAASQIANARAAGLRVSVYHYAWFATQAQARAEARYFATVAKQLGLDTSTVMVNDIEQGDTKVASINENMAAWEDEMRRMGYHYLVHYTSASWLDAHGWGGPIQTGRFGYHNFWVAQYPKGYAPMSFAEAQAYSYNKGSAAWQFTSVHPMFGKRFDLSIDYTGRFT